MKLPLIYLFTFSTFRQWWLVMIGVYAILGSWRLQLLKKERERFGLTYLWGGFSWIFLKSSIQRNLCGKFLKGVFAGPGIESSPSHGFQQIHLVLWDIRPIGLTASKAGRVCDRMGITISMCHSSNFVFHLNFFFFQKYYFRRCFCTIPSDIRIATSALTSRDMKEDDIKVCGIGFSSFSALNSISTAANSWFSLSKTTRNGRERRTRGEELHKVSSKSKCRNWTKQRWVCSRHFVL